MHHPSGLDPALARCELAFPPRPAAGASSRHGSWCEHRRAHDEADPTPATPRAPVEAAPAPATGPRHGPAPAGACEQAARLRERLSDSGMSTHQLWLEHLHLHLGADLHLAPVHDALAGALAGGPLRRGPRARRPGPRPARGPGPYPLRPAPTRGHRLLKARPRPPGRTAGTGTTPADRGRRSPCRRSRSARSSGLTSGAATGTCGSRVASAGRCWSPDDAVAQRQGLDGA